jgi:hypothetical protein
MGRTTGATSKIIRQPESFVLDEEDRMDMIAALIVELIKAELCSPN